MNKLALVCTVLLLALTGVAFVHDRQAETAPAVLPEPPTPVAASAPMVQPSKAPKPLLTAAVLKARVKTEVLDRLHSPEGVERFSRVRIPSREFHLSWSKPPHSQAPTPTFELYENNNPFSRAMRRTKVATGHIDRTTGRITLTLGAGKPMDVEAGLLALGIE